MVKQAPMIFSQAMMKALLEGQKTECRLPADFAIKLSPTTGFNFQDPEGSWWACGLGSDERETMRNFVKTKAPLKAGDLIWIRETFRYFNASNECGCSESPCGCPRTGTPLYKASHDDGESKWRPSVHMPKRLSRITLRVTSVELQNIARITKHQAEREGSPVGEADPVGWFRSNWDARHGDWLSAPYLWRLQFDVLDRNVLSV